MLASLVEGAMILLGFRRLPSSCSRISSPISDSMLSTTTQMICPTTLIPIGLTNILGRARRHCRTDWTFSFFFLGIATNIGTPFRASAVFSSGLTLFLLAALWSVDSFVDWITSLCACQFDRTIWTIRSNAKCATFSTLARNIWKTFMWAWTYCTTQSLLMRIFWINEQKLSRFVPCLNELTDESSHHPFDRVDDSRRVVREQIGAQSSRPGVVSTSQVERSGNDVFSTKLRSCFSLRCDC